MGFVENLHRHSSVTSRLTVNFQLQLSRLNEKVGMRLNEKVGVRLNEKVGVRLNEKVGTRLNEKVGINCQFSATVEQVK